MEPVRGDKGDAVSESKIKLSEAITKLSTIEFRDYQLAEHLEEWLMYHKADPVNYPLEEAIGEIERAIRLLRDKKKEQWIVTCSGNGTS